MGWSGSCRKDPHDVVTEAAFMWSQRPACTCTHADKKRRPKARECCLPSPHLGRLMFRIRWALQGMIMACGHHLHLDEKVMTGSMDVQ